MEAPDSLETTVVGSYPAYPPSEEFAQHLDDFSDPYLSAVQIAVEDQLQVGIDILTPGQPHADLLRLFLYNFSGISIREEAPVVFHELVRIKTESLTYKEAQIAQSALQGKALLRLPITGPYTLGKSLTLSHGVYKTRDELFTTLAELLNTEMRLISPFADYLSLDEPFYSVTFPETGLELIEATFKDITLPKILHACGNTASLFESLIEAKVDILDFEFTNNQQNIPLLADYDFDQRVAIGCVSSLDKKIESVKTIKERITYALTYFPPEKLLIKPDCGLRNLTREIAFDKLNNMKKARDKVLQNL